MTDRKPGRPSIEQARDFRLPDVRVTKDELIMLKLKARVYGQGGMSEYVRELIERDNRPYPRIIDTCLECNGEVYSTTTDITHYICVADQEREITIRNFPASKCTNCAKEVIDVVLGAEVEGVIDDLISGMLNSRDGGDRYDIPSDIDFANLLNPSLQREKVTDEVIAELNKIGIPMKRGAKKPKNGIYSGIVGTRNETLIVNIPPKQDH